jgi:iron(III) transport system permease protein
MSDHVLPSPAAVAPRRARPATLALTAVAVALVLALPVIGVLAHLLLPSEGVWAHLVATVLADYVANTLVLLIGVGAGAAVVGVATAWLVVMCRFPGRGLFEWTLVLPLAVPAYVVAYAYTDFLQVAGPVQTTLRALTGWEPRDYWFPEIRSLGGAIAMFVFVLYPYVYLLARAAFLEQSVCVLDVSRTLGCGPWASFRRVALPLARPAVVAGGSLALMEVLNDFGTVAYFAVPTFTTGIYRAWFSLGDRVAAAQLSSALLTFAFALLALERLSRRQRGYQHTSRRYRALPSYRLAGARAAAAVAACAAPVLLGFVLPGAILLRLALGGAEALPLARDLRLAANSLLLATLAAALAVALALVVAYGRRLQPTRTVRAANWLAGMGYAVPGSIIAVGVLIPLAAFDNALDAWMRASFGLSTGLLLTGSIAALVYAYVARFLAVSLHTVEASLQKVTPHMDQAARSLGLTPARLLARVHAPIIAGSLLSAGLIVFVDVMKELPATIIMRPFNFDTLAVQAYNLAKDERLAEAAVPALGIVAAGLIPVVVLSWSIARARPGARAPDTTL